MSIFFVAFVAVLAGIVVAILVTRYAPPQEVAPIPPEDDLAKDAELPTDFVITMELLRQLGSALCKKHQLTIQQEILSSENECSWVAVSEDPFLAGTYVLCFHIAPTPGKLVTMMEILEFKDFLKGLRSTKGFYFTSGYFAQDVHQPLEGPTVTLYNRRRIRSEIERLAAS